ncbi:hypothetical protein LENED_009708 [Lentinula edodes]|uniref:Uncharacterized protein n=1 Tax=Lentinula edodes TaxID=5353 RepID=A0A1Q3EKK4_LENED|nr:hypothetical protein LENED_009708 [Lentinula edodes]
MTSNIFLHLTSAAFSIWDVTDVFLKDGDLKGLSTKRTFVLNILFGTTFPALDLCKQEEEPPENPENVFLCEPGFLFNSESNTR